MVLEVFDSFVLRIQVNIPLVVESLARIFDVKAKVRDVIVVFISMILHYIGPLDWTSDEHPSRRCTCLSAADE